VVIFGATGDLTHRKLIPALYNIAACGDLPPQFKVVGFARRDKSDEVFRTELEEGNRKNSRQGHSDRQCPRAATEARRRVDNAQRGERAYRDELVGHT
jgi:glucose-6-phosphate 1-dehydrogenase